jgi:hypothetical protein
VACQLKARIVKPAETAVAMQWLSNRYVMAATDTHAATEELLGEVFSLRSMSRLYNEDQLPLRDSLEAAASLRGREPGNRGWPAVGRCYQVSW